MRRSSWIALCGAGLMLALFALPIGQPVHSQPSQMSAEIAARLIRDAREALERGDAGGIVRLVSPSARLFGQTQNDLQDLLSPMLDQVVGHFSVATRDLSIRQDGRFASISFVMDIGQSTDVMEAVYCPNVRVDLRLERVRTQGWLGLSSAYEWKIIEATSVPKPDIPSA
jgi:hypothetical protein